MERIYGEKIIESLKVIKTVCEDNIDNCGIRTIPFHSELGI